MPRNCVMCGRNQSSNLCVFSFPLDEKQRKLWVSVVNKVKQDFVLPDIVSLLNIL